MGQQEGRPCRRWPKVRAAAGPTFVSRVVDGVHGHLQGRRLPAVLSATARRHASIAGAISLTRESRSAPASSSHISPWVPLQPLSPQPSVTEAPPPLPEGPIPPHTAWPSCSHTKPFPAWSWGQTPDSPTLSRHEYG